MVADKSPWLDCLESKRGCNDALNLAGGQGGVPVPVERHRQLSWKPHELRVYPDKCEQCVMLGGNSLERHPGFSVVKPIPIVSTVPPALLKGNGFMGAGNC